MVELQMAKCAMGMEKLISKRFFQLRMTGTMRKRMMLITGLIFLIFLGFGLFLYKSNSKVDYHGYLLRVEKAADFTLINQYGNHTILAQFREKGVLLYFGYTHCPDACPMTHSLLKESLEKLGKERNRVQILFITIDPERYTAQKLKDYVPYFDKDFLGLTGTSQQITKVAKDYDIFYEKEPDAESNVGYFMTHSTSVYLINPEGELLLEYPITNLNPDWIDEDIRKILD
jgi:protein SCO1